jgi:hypothetical protein
MLNNKIKKKFSFFCIVILLSLDLQITKFNTLLMEMFCSSLIKGDVKFELLDDSF